MEITLDKIKLSKPEDMEVKEEINKYINYKYEFNDFLDVPAFEDGELSIHSIKKTPADIRKKWVPSYCFIIKYGNLEVGHINLRIGYTVGLYFGGNIGYYIKEDFRGNGFAGIACKLISKVAKLHKMKYLIITNEYNNYASFRVCEKIGAKYLRTVKLPEDNEMRRDGDEAKNIFLWTI